MENLVPYNCLPGKRNFLERFFAVRSAPMTQYMHCATHDRLCPTDQGSKLDIAGLPCQPNSSVGGLAKEEDARFAVWLIFCFWQIWKQTLCFVIENVKVCPPWRNSQFP